MKIKFLKSLLVRFKPSFALFFDAVKKVQKNFLRVSKDIFANNFSDKFNGSRIFISIAKNCKTNFGRVGYLNLRSILNSMLQVRVGKDFNDKFEISRICISITKTASQTTLAKSSKIAAKTFFKVKFTKNFSANSFRSFKMDLQRTCIFITTFCDVKLKLAK